MMQEGKNVSGLVPILDDSHREIAEMLSEMHDKLSQAVKLYDHLLTQQISQPRWRSSLPAMSPSMSYQQAVASHNPPQGLQNDHQQWTAAHTSVPVPSEPTRVEQTQLSQREAQPLQVYPGPPVVQDYRSAHVQAHVLESGPQQQPSHPQLTQFSSPSGQASDLVRSQPGLPGLPTGYQTSGPSQYAQYPGQVAQATVPAAPTPTTTSFNQAIGLLPASTPLHQTSSPAYLPQSPPPPQQHISQPVSAPSHPPSATSLTRLPTRHNTVAGTTRIAYLSRHNSSANTPMHQPHQPILHQTPAAVTTFPQFPVAPTTAPQAYPLYGPSVPTDVIEKKEALLIDL